MPKSSKEERIKHYIEVANRETLSDIEYVELYGFMFDELAFSHCSTDRTIEDIKRAVKTGKKLPPEPELNLKPGDVI